MFVLDRVPDLHRLEAVCDRDGTASRYTAGNEGTVQFRSAVSLVTPSRPTYPRVVDMAQGRRWISVRG